MLLLITTGVKGFWKSLILEQALNPCKTFTLIGKRKENSVAEIMKIIFPESFFVGGKPGLYLKCYQNKPNENKSNRNKTKTKQIRKKPRQPKKQENKWREKYQKHQQQNG